MKKPPKIKKKVPGFVQGGSILKTVNKDPNYVAGEGKDNSLGGTLGDIGKFAVDTALVQYDPNAVKQSDYSGSSIGKTLGDVETVNESFSGQSPQTKVITSVSGTDQNNPKTTGYTPNQQKLYNTVLPIAQTGAGIGETYATKGLGSINLSGSSTSQPKAPVGDENGIDPKTGEIVADKSISGTPLLTQQAKENTEPTADDHEAWWRSRNYKKGGDVMKYKNGSSIKINPKNVGKFNATKKATGETTEELTHSSNPVTKKRAVFAQNASHWNHKAKGGDVSPAKALEILHDGTIRGHKITDKQRRYFGYMSNQNKASGGVVEGKGTGTSDSNSAALEKNDFIIPAKQAKTLAVKRLLPQLGLNKIAPLQDGNVPIKISKGEVIIPKEDKPMANAILGKQGLSLNRLAPNAKSGIKKGGKFDTGTSDIDPLTGEKRKPLQLTYGSPYDNVSTPVETPYPIPATKVVTPSPVTKEAPVVTPTEKSNSNNLIQGIGVVQGLTGLYNANKLGKVPVDTIPADYTTVANRLNDESNFGLSPLALTQARTGIERNRRAGVKNILSQSGGDAGTALGNIQAAGLNADDAVNDLAVTSDKLRQAKLTNYANFVADKSRYSRQLFEDKLNRFDKQENTAGANVSAGIHNVIEGQRLSEAKKSADQRAKAEAAAPYMGKTQFTQAGIKALADLEGKTPAEYMAGQGRVYDGVDYNALPK